MTLRKITIGNFVRYVKRSVQTRETKSVMMKNKKQSEQNQPFSGGSKPNMRKQNKNISQNNKSFLKIYQQMDLVILQNSILTIIITNIFLFVYE